MAAAALARLMLMARLALADNTESRYALIGWLMFRSGNWVTPHVYKEGQLSPFLGKPPLGFWLTSLSYTTLGVSDLASRLPNFVIGLAIVAATIFFCRHFFGGIAAALAGVILATSALFFVLAGACVLDVPLAAATSGAMMTFARFAHGSGHRRAWGLGFFLSLAVGMLAKGPVALVLVGLPIGAWLLLTRRWRLVIELPWLGGLALFFAVAAPWYFLAEKATPGFLKYFLINEHFLRYLQDEYGDKYGFGQKRPYGAIWLILLGTLLPWTLLGLAAWWRLFRRKRFVEVLRGEPWLAYVLFWGLAPAVFFTFARQILVTYLIPGFPGLAVAVAVGLERWISSDTQSKLFGWLRWHFAFLGLMATGGIVAAVWLGSIPLAVVFAGMAAFSGWLARPNVRCGCAELTAIFGLGMTVTFSAAVLLLAPRIDDDYSTKTILGVLYRDPAARERPVVMPFGEVYSAAYYAEAAMDGRFEHRPPRKPVMTLAMLDAPGDEIFLLKRQNWKELPPELSARLVPVAQTGHWVASERRPR